MILTPITQHGGSILLQDHHGEYTGSLAGVTYDDGKWCRALVIWDGFNLSSVRADLGLPSDDDAIDAAFRTMFDTRLDAFLTENGAEPYNATIWEISGEGMHRAFDQLFNALDTIPSGDDDTFDYWPNTMDMLWEFACDLDTMHSTADHRTRVRDMAIRVHDQLLTEDWTKDSGVDDPTEMQGSIWLDWKGDNA